MQISFKLSSEDIIRDMKEMMIKNGGTENIPNTSFTIVPKTKENGELDYLDIKVDIIKE